MSQGSDRKEPTIRRQHGQRIVVMDVASGRRTVLTCRSQYAVLSAAPDPGMVVLREELLDEEAK